MQELNSLNSVRHDRKPVDLRETQTHNPECCGGVEFEKCGMDYDDIDVTMLNNRDSFGLVETNAPKIQSVVASNSDRLIKKPPAVERTHTKREFFDARSAQSKHARKAKNDEEAHEKRNESKKVVEPVPTDFRYKPAVTFQEKLSVLEDRDRHLRETTIRDKNMNIITEGTCPDMCPEKERLLREVNCSFSLFEGQIVQNEMHVVPEFLVKEYARSSADQDEPLPHELRPEPVLIDTMSHLLTNIIPKIEEPNVDVAEWYNFCWDRLRSLRKDIIQQQLCSRKIVELLEQSARFHICCFDRLFDRERGVFDDKINAENLVNCLQMLITMYEDLEAIGLRCANECEFRIYMMLLLLDSNDLPGIPTWYDDDSRRRVEEITDIYFAFKLRLCTKFFKLVKKTHYLNACILQRYFTTIRAHTLNTLVNAYSPGSQVARFPLTFVKRLLEVDSDDETISLVSHYGFTANYETNEIRASKSSFSFPDTQLARKSSYIVEAKRVPIVEAVTRTRNYRVDRKASKVHSSFGENDILQRAAWNAEDQRAKVIELYGDIYQTMQHSTSFLSVNEISDDDYDMGSEPETSFVASASNAGNTVTVRSISSEILFPPPPSPPKNVFTIGSISLASKAEDMVDADYPCIRPSQPLPPSPSPLLSPKVAATKSSSISQSSPVADKCFRIFTLHVVPPPATRSPPSITADESSEPVKPVQEPQPTARKPDEIVGSLTDALSQFEQVYWDHFGVTEDDRLAFQRYETLKENRKLRRVVKNRLKRVNARKAARVWRRKVEMRRKREENFVGITHLPPHEYFRLWGTVRKHDTSSLVEEMLESQCATKWSRSMLDAKTCSVNCIASKLADHLINVFRRRPSCRIEGQLPLVTCWKTILAVSDCEDSTRRSFVNKLSEFCRALFYEDENSELGSVQRVCTSFQQVLVSVHVKCGLIPGEDLRGVSNLTVIANEQWETGDQFAERVTCVCENLSYAIHVSVIIIGECSYKTNISDLLAELHREGIISGWSATKWKNFFTVPNALFKSLQFAPTFPAYRVKRLESFVESVGHEFFAHLFYVWADRSENSPIVFIDLYNTFLTKLTEALDAETSLKYNFSPEFLPLIVGREDARSNLTHEEVPHLIGKYSLISFTKWPPHSVEKMSKLLRKYCAQIEEPTCGGTLLPNVLRLLNADDDASVEHISGRAPWLKIVELWFRYHLSAVSKREDANRVFVFYDEDRVVDVAKGLWIEKLLAK